MAFFVCVNGEVEYNAAEIIQNKKSMKQKNHLYFLAVACSCCVFLSLAAVG
jgi:hypothetical protein